MPTFSHLHCHSQYSLLDGASSLKGMINKAKADGMPAVALTDHGNMFGVFQFVNEARKANIKPVIGCEFYVVEDRHKKQFTRGAGDKRYHQLIWAKNQKGYENISKLCSLGYIEGMYSKYPRIDKELIKLYCEGLMATTCCLAAEVPRAIVQQGEEAAEAVFKEWLEIFGEDYFIELQRHGIKSVDGGSISQEDVNQVLLKWSKKYNVPVVATNDSHYIEEEDNLPHDILLCVNTGELLSTPKGYGKGQRFGFENSQFYFKNQAEMNALFADVPEAIDNTNLIIDRVETPNLQRDVLLPNYTLPAGFDDQATYLKHITFEGAKKRYGQIPAEVEERLNFELDVINNSGYPGYFLIVQDFTSAARDMDVWVGPGRGSAAGSLVAYCLGITNVDPIEYDLLFERFLNPERISLPDIDIDFDDEGRQKVIDYVVDKYGKNQVAQIITYGSMAAKSAIRDVGRVLDVPLGEVDKIAKSFPETLGAKLTDVLADADIAPGLKERLNNDDLQRAVNFRKMAESDDQQGRTIRLAKELEGSIRNTGVHACGIIITPDDMSNYVPLARAKDSELYITQYDNSVVESAGLLKMDFLGLKTLSILKDTVEIVKERHGKEIDLDTIPLDDEKTYNEIFQKGATAAIFQYESAGMRRYLKQLKPNHFDDLIAMNALYRPGPMQYIPEFIDRKHGRKPITYDLPEMEEFLAETYGITVYQEQVMLLSQKLAGFSKGQADMLRKGMGKKKKAIIDELLPKFLEGCEANGHPKPIVEKIWKDWEAFASYAFNKSHSTCYALLGYQTAYLKANYPAEFMAAVLTHNMGDIKKVTFFMNASRKVGVEVLGPSVNESKYKFNVNSDGAIRFGLGAIKGVGQNAVESLIVERNENGKYSSIFDLTKRVDLQSLNKRTLESMVLAGAFDEFEGHRAQYFHKDAGSDENIISKALKYGQKLQAEKNSAQQSLFGGGGGQVQAVPEPQLPICEPWSKIEKLSQEREMVGVFISGHPLDKYQLEFEQFTNTTIAAIDKMKDKKVRIGGVVTKVNERFTKKGDRFAIFTIEDFSGSLEIPVFSEKYHQYRFMLHEGELLYVVGKYGKKWRDSEDYGIRLEEIHRLDGIMKQYTNALQLNISYKDLSEDIIDELEKIATEHKGEIPIHFYVGNGESNKGIKFHSMNRRIDLNKVVLTKLQEVENIGIELLKNNGN